MDFNDLFILECFQHEEERKLIESFSIPSLKDFNISTRYQFLKKEEYLVEDPNDTSRVILSVKGQEFLDNIDAKTEKEEQPKIISGKTTDECFEEWWKAFPGSSKWESDDGNTIFIGSRALKNLKKDVAKKRYLKLLNQGLLHDDLIGSLRYEIKLKKLDSIKKNANQMEYFKGMDSYLNQERYLVFIDSYRANPEFVKSEEKIKSRKKNVKDI